MLNDSDADCVANVVALCLVNQKEQSKSGTIEDNTHTKIS